MAARLALEPFTADRAPYALNFLAVLIAAVLGGWRSGFLALAAGQLLTWYAVVEPQWSIAVDSPAKVWGLAVATLSQALMLLVIGLFQREVDKGAAERERRLELQEHARREIDHRIRNNFQTVLALIHIQAQRTADAGAKQALRQVAERITAIASVTERLALRGEGLAVSIREHLCEICEQLEQGLADGIAVHCEIPDIEARAVQATYLGLIVNELVTNALKHAFPDGRSGWVHIEGRLDRQTFALVIRDNGTGMKARKSKSGSGLGQKLVETFVRELGGKHELSTSDQGTSHTIQVPDFRRRPAGPGKGRPISPAPVPAAATARS